VSFPFNDGPIRFLACRLDLKRFQEELLVELRLFIPCPGEEEIQRRVHEDAVVGPKSIRRSRSGTLRRAWSCGYHLRNELA